MFDSLCFFGTVLPLLLLSLWCVVGRSLRDAVWLFKNKCRQGSTTEHKTQGPRKWTERLMLGNLA